MCKNLLNLRNVVKIAVACLAVMSVPFTASGQVCQIGSTNYNTVEAAISAVPSGAASATTISMLQDYQVNNGMYINNKKIVFALNGHTLTFYNSTTNNNGRALDLDNNTNVSYSGAGDLKVSTVWGVALKGYNSSATVTYVAQTSNSMYAVEHQGTGQFVVNGNVDAGSGSGINCHDGGAVTVGGQVYAYSVGVHAGVSANGRMAIIRVYGNVAAIDATNGIGAETNNSAQIFVVGYISAKNYIHVGSTFKAQTPYPTMTPDGYYDYTDNNSHVLVKPAVAAIWTHNFETLQGAFDAVPAGTATATTVDLLMNHTNSAGFDLSNKSIVLKLNGYTVTQNGYLVVAQGGKFYTNGSGAFNINLSTNLGIDAEDGAIVQITGNVSTANYWAIDAKGATVHIDGNVSNTGATAAGVYAYNGGRAEINGTLTATKYIQTGTVVKAKTDFTMPSDLGGYAKYTDGTNNVYVKGTAPTITGGTASLSVQVGYTAMSTSAFTISGDPAPRVTKSSGSTYITWNDATKKIDIAPGLGIGSYTVALSAQNGITPNGSYSFTFTVSAPPICQIGSTNYTTLDDAIAAVPTGGATATIIKLLTDITHDGGYTITNKKITFDLNGKNLIFNGTTTPGLTLSNTWIDCSGTGSLKAISTGNDGLNISGGLCNLTYVETSKSAGGCNAVYCWNGGQVDVEGTVTSTGNNGGICSDGTGSKVTLNGNITSGGNGINATAGGAVTVTGNITAANHGIFAGNGTGSKVTVTGNITAVKNGIYAGGAGAIVTVNGNIVSSGSDGIFANNNVTVNVTGSISANGSGKWAILAEGGTITVGSVINSSNGVAVKNSGTNVTVDGTITATGTYIQLNGVNKIKADGVADPAKSNYLKYTDSTSTVWVKNTGTGIEDVQANNPVKAWVADGTLHVSGLMAGQQWSVYSITGALIHQGIATGDEVTQGLASRGIYIVQAGNRTVKVVN